MLMTASISGAKYLQQLCVHWSIDSIKDQLEAAQSWR